MSAFPGVGVGAPLVVVGSEVMEPGFGILQEVPDDDEDGTPDGDDGPCFSPPPGQPPLAFA